MIKAPDDLQELRRKIYAKAKAEPSWRFWGLYVHVCKMGTLRSDRTKGTGWTRIRVIHTLRKDVIGD